MQALVDADEATDSEEDVNALVAAAHDCKEDLLEEVKHLPGIHCRCGGEEERGRCDLNKRKRDKLEGFEDVELAVVPSVASSFFKLFEGGYPRERGYQSFHLLNSRQGNDILILSNGSWDILDAIFVFSGYALSKSSEAQWHLGLRIA